MNLLNPFASIGEADGKFELPHGQGDDSIMAEAPVFGIDNPALSGRSTSTACMSIH
jgi:hypothetical protein